MTDMTNIVDLFETMKALDAGIVPFNFDINKSLNDMDPVAARKMKRKYRKLLRKHMQNTGAYLKTSSLKKNYAKRSLKNELRQLAREEVLRSQKKKDENQ